MDKTEMYKLITFNNETWELMKKHMNEVAEFLADGTRSSALAKLLCLSVKLVLSELILNRADYEKYPEMGYSEEDFLDMVINSVQTDVPGLDDQQTNNSYIEEIRAVIWGHIKKYSVRLPDIVNIVNEFDEDSFLTEDDVQIFMECLTVSWVECVLRHREATLLERNYGG